VTGSWSPGVIPSGIFLIKKEKASKGFLCLIELPDLPTARRILGDKAIIGVTASSVEEAQKATKDGADYLGIGTVFASILYTGPVRSSMQKGEHKVGYRSQRSA
jgi:hypothetical protein